ncbi:MAG TPA: hypothetical protein DCQ47_05460 [Gammaproteobacteria bacterium]|nr:hypothetical protein [Gammaproteobacteria bacterium]
MKSVTLVIRSGPTQALGTREMIDMALVLATFDCPVSVILQDAGVLWATLPEMPDSSPLAISGKLKSLPLYDVGTILVDQESCSSWDFEPSDQFPGSVVSHETIKQCLDDSDVLLEA